MDWLMDWMIDWLLYWLIEWLFDSLKVYDLALDALSPQYYFLLPTGKIRDVTFMYAESDGVHLVLMGSSGYIYTQVWNLYISFNISLCWVNFW